MRYTVTIWTLCVVAIAGLCAIIVASASASEPALWECAKAAKVDGHYTGRYEDKSCSEENTTGRGKFEMQEWQKEPGAAKSFKGVSKGLNWEISGVIGVTCTSSVFTGEVAGAKAFKDVSITLSGCEVGHRQCENGGTLGEIKLNPLQGELGYVNKAAHEVGVILSSEVGRYIAEYHCAELHIRWSGAVIGVITPTNVFTKGLTLAFEQSAGEQYPRTMEGFAGEYVPFAETVSGEGEFGAPLKMGISDVVTVKGEELELKA
jgi:hypothetical protein